MTVVIDQVSFFHRQPKNNATKSEEDEFYGSHGLCFTMKKE